MLFSLVHVVAIKSIQINIFASFDHVDIYIFSVCMCGSLTLCVCVCVCMCVPAYLPNTQISYNVNSHTCSIL